MRRPRSAPGTPRPPASSDAVTLTVGDVGGTPPPGGSGDGLARAWASAGSTVTMVATTNVVVPATAPFRRKSRLATMALPSPSLLLALLFPMGCGI
jgi:hypothetical protein